MVQAWAASCRSHITVPRFNPLLPVRSVTIQLNFISANAGRECATFTAIYPWKYSISGFPWRAADPDKITSTHHHRLSSALNSAAVCLGPASAKLLSLFPVVVMVTDSAVIIWDTITLMCPKEYLVLARELGWKLAT